MPRHRWKKGHRLSEASIRQMVSSRKATMAVRGYPSRSFTDEQRASTGQRFRDWFAADPARREESRKRMAALARSKKGQKQTPEQIEKRKISWLRTWAAKKAAGYIPPKRAIYRPWSAETRKKFTESFRERLAHKAKERTIKCAHCGAVKVKNNIVAIKKYSRHFCTHACYVKNMKAGAATDPGIRERRSGQYNNWRRRILRRDKNKCRNCGIGKEESKLHAHHILSYAKFAQFRFDGWNGKLLCRRCHALVHRNHELRSKTESLRAIP